MQGRVREGNFGPAPSLQALFSRGVADALRASEQRSAASVMGVRFGRCTRRALLAATAAAVAVSGALAAAIPGEDWAEGIARHDLLFDPTDPAAGEPQLQPVLSNGLVGWTVDAPHVFLAGVYNGEGRPAPSHRARIPATLALEVAVKETSGAAEGTYLGA